MKTFKLKSLFAILVCTGLLLSCSNDDDGNIANDPGVTPTTFGGPRSNADNTPLALNFSASLTNTSEDASCNASSVLYQHSGEGSSDITGDFVADITYCRDPQSLAVSNFQITLEDSEGDMIFLSQRNFLTSDEVDDVAVNDDPNEVNAIGQDPENDTNQGNLVTNNNVEDGFLYLEITGGTGKYEGASGEISSRLTRVLAAASEVTNFNFSGSIAGLQ